MRILYFIPLLIWSVIMNEETNWYYLNCCVWLLVAAVLLFLDIRGV